MHTHDAESYDDVLLAVQERARREKRTAREVLSDLARQALTGQHRPPEDRGTERHGFCPYRVEVQLSPTR